MSKHDYALEPNGMFSPDMKWLIFRSNMSGANQVYAVELKRADGKPGYQGNTDPSFYCTAARSGWNFPGDKPDGFTGLQAVRLWTKTVRHEPQPGFPLSSPRL